MNTLRGRLGLFLLLIGLGLLGIFFASDQSQNPQFGLFFLGAFLMTLGGFWFWRGRTPPPPSERFRLLRKMMSSSTRKKK